jgi:hypothetical protein
VNSAVRKNDYVSPGAFVVAIGVDSPEKQELDLMLPVSNTADLVGQCAARSITPWNSEMFSTCVHAALGDMVFKKA